MLSFTHIINPVNIGPNSDLRTAQPITFESIKRAISFSSNEVNVNLVTAQFIEDHSIIPSHFHKTEDMKRSVLDVASFTRQRKLPLLKEILDRAYQASGDSDYVIYSNVDIAVMPHFYQYISNRISEGYDSLIVNRRTVSDEYLKITDLSYMYAQIGKKHSGFDCFVFKRTAYPNFVLKNTCVGANWLGRVLYSNLLVFGGKVFIEKQAHLTFHIGDNGAWMSGSFNDFDHFNKNEAYKVIDELKSIPIDRGKLEELDGVKAFMDNWGKRPRMNLRSYPKRLINKIAKYLK